MANFSEMLRQNREAARLMEDPGALRDLAEAPETQSLLALLRQSAGDLEGAARSAAGGDAAPLLSAFQKVLESREGAEAARKITRRLQK